MNFMNTTRSKRLLIASSLLALAVTPLAACDDGDVPPVVQDGRLGAANPPALGVQVDRAGRPAISTALIATFNGDDAAAADLKNKYSAADSTKWGNYKAEIQANLAILDAIDATCGNQLLADDTNAEGRYAGLADVLLDDQLYVHADRGTCGVYLGLEAEVVGAVAEGDGGCGGRKPADDVIERSYSVLAAGALTGVDDLITADDKGFSDTFPYLAAP